MAGTHPLEALLRERIVIIDGAMGTTIQQYKLTEEQFRGERFRDWKGKDLKGNNELLNLTQPQIIEEIHRRYFEAGADIVETNTFNGQFISLADYGMESLAYELAHAGAECARRAADAVMAAQPGRVCFVAGAIGPTTKTSSISTDVNDASARGTTWDELVRAYGEQARAFLVEFKRLKIGGAVQGAVLLSGQGQGGLAAAEVFAQVAGEGRQEFGGGGFRVHRWVSRVGPWPWRRVGRRRSGWSFLRAFASRGK